MTEARQMGVGSRSWGARVTLFATLREVAGASEGTLELPEGARVSDAAGSVAAVTRGCRG